MQIRSRDLLQANFFFKWEHLIFFNFGVRFMILRPVDTSFLRLEKLR